MKITPNALRRSPSARLCPNTPLEDLWKLEAYRELFERERNVTTDISRQYTSQLPWHQQVIMMQSNPRDYFDGLPEYVQQYVKKNYETSKSYGTLDDDFHKFTAQILTELFDVSGQRQR